MQLNDSQDTSPARSNTDNDKDLFKSSLPQRSDSWQSCDLGPPNTWSTHLQAYTFTISSVSYPAAIFYGDALVLLHNKAWGDLEGNEEQGCAQRGRLSADVWGAFQAAMRGEPGRQITSRNLLKTRPDNFREDYTVCLSLLQGAVGKEFGVFLVQLLPRSTIELPQAKSQHTTGTEEGRGMLIINNGINESIPLDKHPFFHRFAEMLPCGLAILDRDAQAVYVNQVFYTMTTHQGSNRDFCGWPESIHPDDKEKVLSAYHEAFAKQETLRTEFRSQADGTNPWRLLLLTPLGDDNLEHVSLRQSGGFICCIVDISSEKFAELSERKAARDAEERKAVLSSFIDMVSHEIRNPLSALLHCAEDISDAINHNPADIGAIESAVETINVCIVHQKNIVDDVLSFSKLDASMLTLVPSACRPIKDIADSLKMFQPALRKGGIRFSFNIDRSYHDCQVTWAMADLARIGQVLINLMSNAIKFTAHGQNPKEIVVNLGASRERPSSYEPSAVSFNLDERDFHMDATQSKEWGNGEALYITVAVKDTGIGISEANQQKLFERFRQATPKTAETYGGSGLGLNISRKLCQLHGGEIGVSAKEGEGSTFAFFFKIRKLDRPTEQLEDAHDHSSNDANFRTRSSELRAEAGERLASRPASVRSTSSFSRGENRIVDVRTDESHTSGAIKLAEGSTVNVPASETFLEGPSSSVDKTHKIHILLVEDNIVNQRILSKRLTSKGYTVTTASNGREAVDAVVASPKPSEGNTSNPFDIILMDNEMPVLDGNGATKEIRGLEGRREIAHIPILGVTANARGAQQDEMIQCGMNDVISKPYRMDDMIERIDKIIAADKK